MQVESSRTDGSRRTALTLLACVPFAALSIAAGAPAANSVDLEITKFAFVPKEITVAPGTKLTWVNRDEAPHTVTGKDKDFASKGLDTGDRYEHTFSTEGDYSYICAVHPFMTGVVHVRKA